MLNREGRQVSRATEHQPQPSPRGQNRTSATRETGLEQDLRGRTNLLAQARFPCTFLYVLGEDQRREKKHRDIKHKASG